MGILEVSVKFHVIRTGSAQFFPLKQKKKLRIREATCLKIKFCAELSNCESDFNSFVPTTFNGYDKGVLQVLCHSGGSFTILPVKTKKLSIREATCFKI